MKKIAVGAINALKDALSSIYWYKSDLRSFLFAVISDNNLFSRINWDESTTTAKGGGLNVGL